MLQFDTLPTLAMSQAPHMHIQSAPAMIGNCLTVCGVFLYAVAVLLVSSSLSFIGFASLHAERPPSWNGNIS